MNDGKWLAALPCAGLILCSMQVAAQPPPPAVERVVTLELPRCPEPPYDDAQLIAHLRLELSARGFRPHAELATSVRARHFRIELALPDCASGSGELTLHVLDPDRRWLVQRRLPFSEIPFEARPRTLALAIAEALDRSDPGSAPGPARAPIPRSSPAPAPPASPAEGLAPPDVSPLLLGFAASYRTPLLASHPFWGGELSVSSSTAGTADRLSWVAEAGFATNTTDTRLGQMRTDWWSVGLGLDVHERGALELAIGPRLELAYVSARPELASAASEGTTEAFLLLWGARAGLALPLGRSWLLRGTLDVEQPFGGLVLTAGGERTLSLEGWLISSGLGVAFRP